MDAPPAFPDSRFWALVAFNTTHVPWQGCSLHDLIQPAFSFLAGASLPFSIASRRAQGRAVRPHARPRGLAQRRADPPRDLPSLARVTTDLLDIRGHADADRPRLHLPVPPGVRAEARADRRVRRDPGRLLGGVRAVSAAGSRLRLHAGRRAGGLAAPVFGLPRALQQELEPGVGVRRLVPESVPARSTVPVQRGRLVDAELHPDARDDDARDVVRRVAEEPAIDRRKAAGARHRRRRARRSPG